MEGWSLPKSFQTEIRQQLKPDMLLAVFTSLDSALYPRQVPKVHSTVLIEMFIIDIMGSSFL